MTLRRVLHCLSELMLFALYLPAKKRRSLLTTAVTSLSLPDKPQFLDSFLAWPKRRFRFVSRGGYEKTTVSVLNSSARVCLAEALIRERYIGGHRSRTCLSRYAAGGPLLRSLLASRRNTVSPPNTKARLLSNKCPIMFQKNASIVKLTLKNQDGHPLTQFLSKNMVLGLKTCSFWPPRFAGGFFLPEVVRAFAMETARCRERENGRSVGRNAGELIWTPGSTDYTNNAMVQFLH